MAKHTPRKPRRGGPGERATGAGTPAKPARARRAAAWRASGSSGSGIGPVVRQGGAAEEVQAVGPGGPPAPNPARGSRKAPPRRKPAAGQPGSDNPGNPGSGEPGPVPGKEEVRAFLRSNPGRVGMADVVRHFGLGADQRPALREVMRALKEDGTAAPVGRRGLQSSDSLPDMAAVEVFGTDPDGDPLARPIAWDGPEKPVIYMRPERAGQAALAPGDKVLARITRIGPGKYEGRTFKRIGGGAPSRILGIYSGGTVQPVDRRARGEWRVEPGNEGGARDGELVVAEPVAASRGRHFGPKPARVVERLGSMDEPRAVSRLCIAQHGIPEAFAPEALDSARRARGIGPEGREDLRDVPLVTIDGEDARDFDDAVFAELDPEGGHRVIVAIADVAHYVRPGTPLDRDAWTRGNSVYFPDRVVPMLPEELSNGWCSLKPGEDRGCLFVEMRFDAEGAKVGHRFGRGIMRSAARLTYEKVQAAYDSGDDLGLPAGHVGRLYAAYRALLAARLRRGTLDLDLPERKVVLGPDGKVLSVAARQRLDSHRLIEEFMVAANVCAAEELERLHQPCMYRIHDRPSDEKLETLRPFLAGLGFTLPPGNLVKPRDFARILEKTKDLPESRLISETILRGQSQAAYTPDNLGHFGLALPRYAHFTSPIRRYADLLVHRALIRGLKLGPDGVTEAEAAGLEETGEHITRTERRAALAERDAVDRYLTAYLADRVGARFDARVSGVTRFGIFVTLEESGANGIVPVSSLPDDQWIHEEAAMRLVGRRTGLAFTLGDEVEVMLAEAETRTGSLSFQIMQGAPVAASRAGRSKAPRATKPVRKPIQAFNRRG
ncbi:ribonuclease R [Roseomonas sp. CCTCC AB2023176]|uniref:ribonuclease R n=1 Tax=Roseomonas sp. CCTCC AB2023176 TaxID=3342640 RepID=UPI0035D595A7